MHTNCNSVFNFRLALYVYEYLLHVGAQKAAQTFLNEVRSHLEMSMKLKVAMKMKMKLKVPPGNEEEIESVDENEESMISFPHVRT